MGEEQTILVTVRGADAKTLKAMVAAAGLRFSVSGWVVKKFSIFGSPEALEAFEPELIAWQMNNESDQAW